MNQELIDKPTNQIKKRSVYGAVLSGAVKKFVEEQMEKPPELQFELGEELALLRHRAADVVGKYAQAVEKKDEKLKLFLSSVMRDELEAVGRMASTAAKICASNTNQITISAMENIISTIVDLIYDALSEEPNGMILASKIEKRISSQVSITEDKGTVSLPSDQLVLQMDRSIPSESLDED